MEDFSSLIWLGIAVVWFITRLIRGGVKKAARARQPRTPPRPPSATASRAPNESPGNRFGGQPALIGRDGTAPPPIVPR